MAADRERAVLDIATRDRLTRDLARRGLIVLDPLEIDSSRPYDDAFADVFRRLIGPLPDAVDLRVWPSALDRPTGLAWIGAELFVVDERRGQVIRPGVLEDRSPVDVVVVGLDQPTGLGTVESPDDPTQLVVADVGGSSLLAVDLHDGLAGDAHQIGDPNWIGPLHFAVIDPTSTNDGLVVVDTATGQLATGGPSAAAWHPHGSFDGVTAVSGADDGTIWIALGRTIESIDGSRVIEHGRRVTALCPWRDALIVADASSVSVRDAGDGSERAWFGEHWMGAPSALAVQADGRLVVADRRRGCLWLIDLTVAN